jgi:hypothetical protein
MVRVKKQPENNKLQLPHHEARRGLYRQRLIRAQTICIIYGQMARSAVPANAVTQAAAARLMRLRSFSLR